MNEFAHTDLSDTKAPNICERCLGHGLSHVPSGCCFVYCDHTECGAMRRPWITATGISAAEFRSACLLAIAAGDDQPYANFGAAQ
jgi:hypothetical protein